MSVGRGGRNTIWYMVLYCMVYGIVPYGIWYRTVRYMESYRTVSGLRVEKNACMCEKEACLLQHIYQGTEVGTFISAQKPVIFIETKKVNTSVMV
jgi:hypothetical protein